MKRLVQVLPVVVTLACTTTVALVPGRGRVMMPSDSPGLHRLCSRPGPPEFEDTWVPSPDVIAQMEKDFGKLLRLKARQCCVLGARVHDVNAYLRQYFGIIVKGKKLVYINAVAGSFREAPDAAGVADYCDGDCWGVLYDPESRRFYDLAFNGGA